MRQGLDPLRTEAPKRVVPCGPFRNHTWLAPEPGSCQTTSGWPRVALAAGERKTVDFALTRAAAGTIEITAGGMAKSCKISQEKQTQVLNLAAVKL